MDTMQAIIANVYAYIFMGEFKGRLVHLYTLGYIEHFLCVCVYVCAQCFSQRFKALTNTRFLTFKPFKLPSSCPSIQLDIS